MSSAVEAIAPARLGRNFRLLLASSWLSNLGDGLSLAAGPLLVASQTNDPLLVAAAAFLQRLPWLLFGLFAGVVADRVDRRIVVVIADSARTAVLIMLAVTVATDSVNVAVVLGAMFLLGTAEAFADVTTNTLLPMLVESHDLGLGNSRLMVGHITANQLVGPPIGALLFSGGMAWPFLLHGVLLAFSASLMWRIAGTRVAVSEHPEPIRRQIVDGMHHLWTNPPVRTLAITIIAFNVTFGAAWSVLVLYSSEQLGLGALGFGLLTTVSAIGGIAGSWAYPAIERRVSLGDIMRVGLIIETLTHLTLAITTTPAVAMVTFAVFGVHTAVWGTTATSIQQRAVPREFQGRVGSVYMIGLQAGLVVGAALGGVIARRWGITAPFWFAFVGSAIILAAIWSSLTQIAHAGTPR
jgi:MFS family permease